MATEPKIRSPITRAFAIAIAIAGTSCGPHPPRVALPRYVAHAMGEVDSHTHTNSLEAWRANYSKGCRLFETDLWMTSDGKLVAFHDGMEAAFGLPKGFTYDDFMHTRILGSYTPLDADRIGQLLAENRDWKVVTDTKGDLRSSLEMLCAALQRKNVRCTERVIPQIYRPETDLSIAKQLGFHQVIFTVYRTRLEDDEIVKIARADSRIVAVTMPPARATKEMVRALSDFGIRCYVHTVNGSGIARQFERGIWGVYTDSGCADLAGSSENARRRGVISQVNPPA